MWRLKFAGRSGSGLALKLPAASASGAIVSWAWMVHAALAMTPILVDQAALDWDDLMVDV